jgi:hypothetical protein
VEELRDVAGYAEALAEHKARKARLEEESEDDEIDERPDDLPDDVPTKATITISTSVAAVREFRKSLGRDIPCCVVSL